MSLPRGSLGSFDRRRFLGAMSAALVGQSGVARATLNGPLRLRRGINFHHLLNWPDVVPNGSSMAYTWPPFADPAHRLEDADLQRAKSLGFDFVRLTLDPGIMIAEGAGSHGLELAAHVGGGVDALLNFGFQVVLDLHPVAVNPDYAPQRLTAPDGAAVMQAYAAMAGRMAALLASAPQDRVALELFNEPPLSARADMARWPPLLKQLHDAARRAAPELPLFLGAARWNDRAALMAMDLTPFRGSNVRVTFHDYDPHLFTHQGVKDGVTAYVSGLGWPVTPLQAGEALGRAKAAIAADSALDAARKSALAASADRQFAPLHQDGHNAARIAADFQELGLWADANGVPREHVLLGEFGCVRGVNGQLAWIEAVRRAAEAEGFAWAYWAYKGYGGMELVDAAGGLHGDLLPPLGLRTPLSR